MDFAPRYEFRACVERYHGHHKVKSFSCWDQFFLTMAFAQLTYRESLRDVDFLRTTPAKLYHMGIQAKCLATHWPMPLRRDWRIYADFAQSLIAIARALYLLDEPFALQLKQAVYALDATTIDLCLSLFPSGLSFVDARPPSSFTRCWICAAVFPRWSSSRAAKFTKSISSISWSGSQEPFI